MKKLFIMVALVMGVSTLSACTSSDERVERTLTQMGYSDVRTTGYRMFGCSQDDTFQTGFVATSPTGETVTGVFCAGLLKGGTVRFD